MKPMPKHDGRNSAARMAGLAFLLAAGAASPGLAADASSPAAPAASALDTASQTVGAAAQSLYQGGSWAFWSVADKAASFYSGVGQALYETSYMIGINSTPLERADFVDSIADLPKGTDPNPPAAKTLPAAVPPPPTVATAAPPPPSDESAETTALKPIEPGLLANLLYDRSARNPDGSYFVPKSLQRMFELRTQRLSETEVRAGIKLNGRIIPDPQAHGQVEAGLLGRIEPPETGMPVLGDAVSKGQVLGYVVPVVGVVDRSQVRREVARLTHEIRQTAESIEMMKQFSFVPFREGKIIQMEIRLDGLRQERAALLPMLKTQEFLRSPIDGVIASTTAVAGRVAQPGEMVFDIVNPKRLWVEATVPDPMIASEAAPGTTATARTPEGQTLNVTYVGSGPAVRQQSTPMLFRIDNPPKGLRVGRPAAILLRGEHHTQRGMPTPRAAISVGADGLQQVWEQTDAETFVPHAVQTQDIDAQTVLILNGVKEGARIVVRGISLMAQVQ
ncbi:HlyD family efflux transporter periplasmic adaptor subunit [Azospirillum cavernae]|uniref:HlyD family efflux transporter periplasmic adaptor subunit n=2 Tax=Azospirillum cavernae TaxID=2320860 RepID=A0A418VPW0_9PROT|nr:HlyD family efflux transporter periplasmic adaptor subunit [Azospirillum cavernae]